MKTNKTFLLSLFIAFIFCSIIGCSAASYDPPKEKIIEKQNLITSSYDDTWGKTIEWFADHNAPIKTLDKTSGFIATEYNLSMKEFEKYCDCGKYNNTFWVSGEYTNPAGNYNVILKRIDSSSTKVTINCFFNVTLNVYGYGLTGKQELFSSQRLECISNGSFEEHIFKDLK